MSMPASAMAPSRRFLRSSWIMGGSCGFRSLHDSCSLRQQGVDKLGVIPSPLRGEMLWGRRRGCGTIVASKTNRWSAPMQRNDLSRSLVAFDQNSTLVAVVELSLNRWVVQGLVPGLSKQPLKALGPDASALLALVNRWQLDGTKGGGRIKRIVVAFEAGRDGFWLARWLRSRGIEVYVIHATSIPVSREHRRAKSDRLDT